jgi:ATP-dependent Clp protease ATP-binding subunit ClpX
MVQIDTKNILFICGGAFDGITKIIGRRVKSQSIGFNAAAGEEFTTENILSHVNQLDIKKYGLIPELIGRFPVLTYLHPLTKETLISILTDPQNALIKQYVKLFEMDNIQLTINEDVLNFIVDKAILLKLGARGLRSICEAILTESMYNAPEHDSKELVIDLSYAEKQFSKSKISQLKVA